ncbi:hypothetical protein PQC13_gp117 [Synechococcus phage S-SRM01]|uniref:Uncharacterized protein n=1 Tax=Synechococcus phage S-SRM01 TaxID=2781608 RepID=A0A879R1L3_9CAUD|nr:hypothetical protein PQC13_gp117 [Synechococcus phage S-SRM01]QPX48082.1 hypothetical protein [Synechococcus phage S-SRM01]
MVEVTPNEDGSYEITWDENDPQESMFNTWTEEDFIRVIEQYLDELIINNEKPL